MQPVNVARLVDLLDLSGVRDVDQVHEERHADTDRSAQPGHGMASSPPRARSRPVPGGTRGDSVFCLSVGDFYCKDEFLKFQTDDFHSGPRSGPDGVTASRSAPMASGRPGWGMVMHGHWWTPGGNGMKPAWKFLAVGLLTALLLSAAYGAAVIQSRGVTPPPHDFPSFLSTNALAVTVVLASAAFVLFILQRSGSPLPGWLGLWTFAFVAFLVYLVAGRIGAERAPVVGQRGRRGVVGHGPGAGLDGRRDEQTGAGTREGRCTWRSSRGAGAIARVAGLVPARAGRADDAGRPRGRGPAGRDRPIRPRFAGGRLFIAAFDVSTGSSPGTACRPRGGAEPGGVPRSAAGEEPVQHVGHSRHRPENLTPIPPSSRTSCTNGTIDGYYDDLSKPSMGSASTSRGRRNARQHEFRRAATRRPVRPKRAAVDRLSGRNPAADAKPARDQPHAAGPQQVPAGRDPEPAGGGVDPVPDARLVQPRQLTGRRPVQGPAARGGRLARVPDARPPHPARPTRNYAAEHSARARPSFKPRRPRTPTPSRTGGTPRRSTAATPRPCGTCEPTDSGKPVPDGKLFLDGENLSLDPSTRTSPSPGSPATGGSGLSLLHTLFTREHNAICDGSAASTPLARRPDLRRRPAGQRRPDGQDPHHRVDAGDPRPSRPSRSP